VNTHPPQSSVLYQESIFATRQRIHQ
jgi:hypothetical protein